MDYEKINIINDIIKDIEFIKNSYKEYNNDGKIAKKLNLNKTVISRLKKPVNYDKVLPIKLIREIYSNIQVLKDECRDSASIIPKPVKLNDLTGLIGVYIAYIYYKVSKETQRIKKNRVEIKYDDITAKYQIIWDILFLDKPDESERHVGDSNRFTGFLQIINTQAFIELENKPLLKQPEKIFGVLHVGKFGTGRDIREALTGILLRSRASGGEVVAHKCLLVKLQKDEKQDWKSINDVTATNIIDIYNNKHKQYVRVLLDNARDRHKNNNFMSIKQIDEFILENTIKLKYGRNQKLAAIELLKGVYIGFCTAPDDTLSETEKISIFYLSIDSNGKVKIKTPRNTFEGSINVFLPQNVLEIKAWVDSPDYSEEDKNDILFIYSLGEGKFDQEKVDAIKYLWGVSATLSNGYHPTAMRELLVKIPNEKLNSTNNDNNEITDIQIDRFYEDIKHKTYFYNESTKQQNKELGELLNDKVTENNILNYFTGMNDIYIKSPKSTNDFLQRPIQPWEIYIDSAFAKSYLCLEKIHPIAKIESIFPDEVEVISKWIWDFATNYIEAIRHGFKPELFFKDGKHQFIKYKYFYNFLKISHCIESIIEKDNTNQIKLALDEDPTKLFESKIKNNLLNYVYDNCYKIKINGLEYTEKRLWMKKALLPKRS